MAKSEGSYKEKGSKFLGYAYPVNSEEECKMQLAALKAEHPKARHHCFAWRFGTDGNAFRANDDGEPGGTAGKPILGQIDSKELTNILVVVVRYFGGTKLGVPGLTNAYRSAAQQALGNARMIKRNIEAHFKLTFEYGAMNEVMKLVKGPDITITKKDFEEECTILFTVPVMMMENVQMRFENIDKLAVEHLFTR